MLVTGSNKQCILELYPDGVQEDSVENICKSTFADCYIPSKLEMSDTIEIAPRTGRAFVLRKGQQLTVIDPEGVQVSDLLAFNAQDPQEVISNGRTFDYANKLYLTTGNVLYSNRSNIMLRIIDDTCGRHDFLLTPCSRDTFRIIYGHQDPHPGCFGNLTEALSPFGIAPDQIPCAFNCFMNVPIDGTTGQFTVEPPISKPGDHIDFIAEMDLIIGMTACSAGLSNGGTFKPIRYRISQP